MKANEIIVDSFAGGGGASLGIAWALGRSPDVAINHDAAALANHEANHPSTLHVREDVWRANLRQLVGGRKVGLLWASPDCKHFSRAKGSTPVSKNIRSLAWVVVRWASQVRPRVIVLENVREFADWGPLAPQWVCRCGWKGTEGQARLARTRRRCPRCDSASIKPSGDQVPDPAKKGMTFRLFTNRLRGLGYAVEWRTLNAADYGAPTHRRRLFLVARRDGAAIEWPEPTHGDPKKLDSAPLFDRLRPWRTAAECIDWSIACPSIFDRKKPLAEKTLRRIALGIKRYVLDNPQPFIVGSGGSEYAAKPRPVDRPFGVVKQDDRHNLVMPYIVPITHNGERRSHGPDEPLPTVTTAHRGEHAICTPILSQYHHSKGDESRCKSLDEPTNTLDTQPRYGLISPTLIQTGYGEREGQSPRVLDLGAPLGAVVAGGAKHAIAAASLIKHFGGVVGAPVDTPLPTTLTSGAQNQLLAANLVRMNHGAKQAHGVDEPMPTVTTQHNKNELVAANLIHLRHGEKQWSGIDEPSRTVTADGTHAALVYSFLVRYFGTAIGQYLTEPLYTVTGHDRFGLVTVTIAGELYYIADIGMRMLTPRELARAQGFPDTYELRGTKTRQVAMIGNSVVPHVAAAIVKANCGAGVEACA